MEKLMKKELVIVGARLDGHAGVVLDAIEKIGGYQIIGFIDNDPKLQNTEIRNIPVLGLIDDLENMELSARYVHIAIGDNYYRGKLYERIKKIGLEAVTLIHPAAIVSENSTIGEGCFIAPLAIINSGSVLGAVSIINSGGIVEHDTKLGLAVHVGPGATTGGRVLVDDFSFLGLGSTILPDIHIGSGVMVGAGATVVKDIPSKTTVIGYAAKKHPKNIYIDAESDVVSGFGKITVAQPTLPDYHLMEEKFRDVAKSLNLSNFAKYSARLECDVENRLGVEKALAFPNCTSALMLALKALDVSGEVILPSFTFSASGHIVVWNGLTPVFADIDPKTFNIDPDDVERKITDKTSAILAVHVFGNPANIDRLVAIAKKHNLRLIFDSAQALGSEYHNKPIGGFGDVECFSLSGTKVITSAEGGIATSNNKDLMKKIHLGRNYGSGKDYDCQYIGINGKMSEFHAVIALESMPLLNKFVLQRNKLASLYKKRLSEIPGISFQHLPRGHLSTFKDFVILVNKDAFGLDRDELIVRLEEEGVSPRKYFFPIHRMKAYQNIPHRAENLVNTEFIADNILSLPIYSHMREETVEKICFAVFRIWKTANNNG